jgi:DNA-binding transcriptional MerR regulator
MFEDAGSYTLVELAKKSGQTTDILRAYINAGKLEGTRVTRGYRISADEANRFLKELESGEMMEFTDITIKKPIEDATDGTTEKIFGIPVSDIFGFMMRILENIKDYNAGGPRNESVKVTSEDIKLLHHLISGGKIDVIPREQRVVVMDSDPVTAFLVKSMATGISCTFEELSKQQNFSVEADKIKAASDFIVKMLE